MERAFLYIGSLNSAIMPLVFGLTHRGPGCRKVVAAFVARIMLLLITPVRSAFYKRIAKHPLRTT